MKYLKNSATLQYNKDLCTGCQRCTEVCPHQLFEMNNKKAVFLDNKKERCMECGACMKNCQYNAISVKAGVGCASAIINGMLTGTEPSCDCSSSSSSCC